MLTRRRRVDSWCVAAGERERALQVTRIVARRAGRVLVRGPARSLERLAATAGLRRFSLPWTRRRMVAGADAACSPFLADELRLSLGELGPTFVKLGQVLSTRPDLVPPPFEAALSSLQDSAPTVAYHDVAAAVRAELGHAPEVVFASFDPVPLAAASIGQVHAARLHSGEAVVVKVRRPGVAVLVDADLAILRRIVGSRLFRLGPLRRVELAGFVEEFASTIRAELDYIAEAANADRARGMLEAVGVHVPATYPRLSSAAVLTLERIEGTKIDDLARLDALGVDRAAVARDLTRAYLSMVFEHGFFHADPHPGNLFVEHGGRLAMVDFGMVGTVRPELREGLVEILLALVTGDMKRDVAALRRLGVVPEDVDESAFVQELERVTQATICVPLGEMRIAPMLLDMMAVGRRHKLRFPRELALLVKTVVMCEGVAAALDPTFALPVELVTFAARVFPPRRSETHNGDHPGGPSGNGAALARSAPQYERPRAG